MKWITRKGKHIKIRRMGSEHLYNTIRCIFNNLIAKDCPYEGDGNWRQYSFWSKAHTKELILSCFEEMMKESKKRVYNLYNRLRRKSGKGVKNYKIIVGLGFQLCFIKLWMSDNPNWENFEVPHK